MQRSRIKRTRAPKLELSRRSTNPINHTLRPLLSLPSFKCKNNTNMVMTFCDEFIKQYTLLRQRFLEFLQSRRQTRKSLSAMPNDHLRDRTASSFAKFNNSKGMVPLTSP